MRDRDMVRRTPTGNTKPATLKEVAAEAGVSIAAVSYALNGNGTVSPDVRAKIKATARKLGYFPNRVAKTMRTGKSNTIGLILPDLGNPFFPELARAVERSARAAGYGVLLLDTDNDLAIEKNGVDQLIQHGIDGIIWCPTTTDEDKAPHFGNTPVVVVDRVYDAFDSVSSDYWMGGRLIARHLQAAGYSKIGLISGPPDIASAKQRSQGLKDNLAAGTMIVWEEFAPFAPPLPNAVRDRIGKGGPDVIVCANDLVAIEVQNLIKRQRSKPAQDLAQDLAVVGFDDISFAAIVTPSLTTIRQPLSELGTEAFDLLIRRISQPDSSKRKVVIDVELVIRESTSTSSNDVNITG